MTPTSVLLGLTQPLVQLALSALLLALFAYGPLNGLHISIPRKIAMAASIPIVIGVGAAIARQAVSGRETSPIALLLIPLLFFPLSLLVSIATLPLLWGFPSNAKWQWLFSIGVTILVGMDLYLRINRIDILDVR